MLYNIIRVFPSKFLIQVSTTMLLKVKQTIQKFNNALNVNINYYLLDKIINIFQMLSKTDKYRKMILQATRRYMLFPHMNNEAKNSSAILQCDIKLPSLHPLISIQQIENNIPLTHHIARQSQQQQPEFSYNQWPHSCIGLVLCEHHQNNQIFYVYGTGTLIHKNIVLTSAQNVYCRRLNIQYTNIKFIVGVSDDKCSGIYDIMRVYYPKEYTMQVEYENYNFAVLQLYDDLSESCGYVGWKTISDKKEIEKYTEYGYIRDNKEGSFKLRQITKHEKSSQDWECCSGNSVLVNQNDNKYSIVGIRNAAKIEEYIILSQKIRNTINQWTRYTTIDLSWNNIGAQGYKYLSQINWKHLTRINLLRNKIDAVGYQNASQAIWALLSYIDLSGNDIYAQGCKYLTQADWTHLTRINLYYNSIDEQGCKYLSRSNWQHLTTIDLHYNKIHAQGCKYLSQANWIHLNTIVLGWNNISAQGCKYLIKANWIYLTRINLTNNYIGAQGCKYLSQANWRYLTQIYLGCNNISAQGCKYLSHANWTHLTRMELETNNIDVEGCKYLIQANWSHFSQINLGNHIIL